MCAQVYKVLRIDLQQDLVEQLEDALSQLYGCGFKSKLTFEETTLAKLKNCEILILMKYNAEISGANLKWGPNDGIRQHQNCEAWRERMY